MLNRCYHTTKITFPTAEVDLHKWAVIACDQFTSQPDYWQAVDTLVGDAPSTLRITLPEVFLENADVDARIADVNKAMADYTAQGVLEELPSGCMLVSRHTGGACAREGLVMVFDLEAYDYAADSASPIRPTEKTIVDRIPPRLAVRKHANLELPHIMLLIDDPDCTVIEPIIAMADQLEKKYDLDLMQDGGHMQGWFVPEGAITEQIFTALDRLSDHDAFHAKYQLTSEKAVFPFAVGDGNHSMATAKANWEIVKQTLTDAEKLDHPARFALAEVVNVHNASLEIEGIHRVAFGVNKDDILAAAQTFFAAHGASVFINTEAPCAQCQSFPAEIGGESFYLCVKNSPWALPIATLQMFLDDYMDKNPTVKLDYIHGADVVHDLAQQPDQIGFLLPDPAKEDLFRGVILDGVLPRKTFSMGVAREKRYYMEAKRIVR